MKTRRGMKLCIALLGTMVLGAGCDSSTAPEVTPPPTIPTLPPVPEADIQFYNNFNGEHGGEGANNYSGFASWNVLGGCVDLHGNGWVDVQAGNGIYVDLDGTCGAGGTIETKTGFDLPAGTYVLEFWLAGNQRTNRPDTVDVSLGTVLQEQIVLDWMVPFRLYTRQITVASATTAALRFHNRGADDEGALLDEVRLRTAP